MTATRTLPRPVRAPSSPSWSALTVLMFGTFMFVLDFFILNVALPSIQQGLVAGEGAIEWVVAGYTISTAVLLVPGGRLGDQFGRRRVFSLGMAIFVATSAACALAPDPAVLVAARVLQGVGAALMAPNILSILGVVYTGPARIRAIRQAVIRITPVRSSRDPCWSRDSGTRRGAASSAATPRGTLIQKIARQPNPATSARMRTPPTS